MKRNKFLLQLAGLFSFPVMLQASKESDQLKNHHLTACDEPLTPPVPEGPFYINEMLNRSGLAEDKQGVPLTLVFTVEDINCKPIPGAIVDIWHCDANGKYSDEAQEGTVGQKWLRGYQAANAEGKCMFSTIFPGWYNGRLTHIHGKVKVGTITKQTTNFFIPKEIEEVVYASPHYAAKGQNPITVGRDIELRGNIGRYNDLMMKVTGDVKKGFVATYTITYS